MLYNLFEEGWKRKIILNWDTSCTPRAIIQIQVPITEQWANVDNIKAVD